MSMLLVEKGPSKGQYIKWNSNSSKIIVGRDERATLTVNDSAISRNHFKIYQQEGHFYVEDLGSRNGTIVDGVNIEKPTLLAIGSCLQIGESIFIWSLPTENDTDPLIGAELYGYLIDDLLGKGGMGKVYKAKQLSLERDVALKILSQKLVSNEVFIQKFIEEARASAKLNHPNIVQVYDVGESDGKYFFSMEYAPGGSIQDIISGGRTLPLDKALAYFKDTLNGLEFAEKKQIIHCDIKPDNLMIAEEDIVKIGDLGLAQSLDNKKEDEQLYGTPHYFAPERITGDTVDHRSDIYSCGAAFYRILTGTTPFKGKNTKEIIRAHVSESLKPPREINSDIPEYLQNIIMKMMAKKPSDRYESNTAILQELENTKKTYITPSTRRHSRIRSLKEEKKSPYTSRKAIFSILHNVLPVVVPSVLFILGYYIFAGKPTKVTPENTVNKTPQEQQTEKQIDQSQQSDAEHKAQQAYLEAIKKHEQEGDTQEVITMLEQIQQKYNGTDYAAKAEGFLRRINKQRNQRQEQKLYSMLQEAILYEEANPFDYQGSITYYQKIVDMYSNGGHDEFVRDAKFRIKRLQNAQEQTEKKQEMTMEFLKYEKEIDSFIKSGQYAKASQVLDNIEAKFTGFNEVAVQILEKRKRINQIFANTLQEKQIEAASLIKAKKYEEAFEIMKQIRNLETKDALETYNELALRIKKAQEKTLSSRKNLVLLSIDEQKKARELLEKYDYQGSSKWLAQVSKKLNNDVAKETLNERIEDMKVLKKLVDRINEKLKRKQHRNAKKEIVEKQDDVLLNLLPKFSAGHVLIKSWNDNLLSVHVPFKFSKSYIGKKVDLTKIPSEWIYENLIENQWSYRTEDLLAIATFCFYYRMYDESWKYYKRYTRKGKKAAKLQKQLRFIEKEAEKKYKEEYTPAMLNLRDLIKKKKRKTLEDPRALKEARKNFKSIDRNYRYSYGKTLFFLKKSNH